MKRLDTSGLVNIAGGVIAIYLIVVLGQTIYRNYTLQKQIDGLNTQISTLTTQRDELTDNLQFYQTSSFDDRQARANLGLQSPGENLIILPHPSDIAATKKAQAKPAPKKSNQRQWLDFLEGKS